MSESASYFSRGRGGEPKLWNGSHFFKVLYKACVVWEAGMLPLCPLSQSPVSSSTSELWSSTPGVKLLYNSLKKQSKTLQG